MEQVVKSSTNMNVHKKIITSDKKIHLKNKKILNTIIKKISIQIIICCILITSIYLYKQYNNTQFEYLNNKYNWIVKYNMTYTNTYNNIAKYLNEKFDFKIPLKEEYNNIENNEYAYTNIEENIDNSLAEDSILESENVNEGAALVSTGYDNMRIMADEIKEKYTWEIPAKGNISSPFGVRDPSRPDISSFHMGIDIANQEKTELFAAIDGEVIEAAYNSVNGNYIKIAKDDIITVYAHCFKLLKQKGDKVFAGEKIALMGSTGISTGPHLHFEIRKNGEVINPEYILNFR